MLIISACCTSRGMESNEGFMYAAVSSVLCVFVKKLAGPHLQQ